MKHISLATILVIIVVLLLTIQGELFSESIYFYLTVILAGAYVFSAADEDAKNK